MDTFHKQITHKQDKKDEDTNKDIGDIKVEPKVDIMVVRITLTKINMIPRSMNKLTTTKVEEITDGT